MKPKEIIQLVSQSVGIPIEEIRSRSRKRELVDARKLLAHFLRKHSTLTLQSIGDELCVRHETVMYYITQIPVILMNDTRLQRIYNSIENTFLVEQDNQVKYKLDIPFLNQEIFIHLMRKNIIWGNSKQTFENLNQLYINNFIN